MPVEPFGVTTTVPSRVDPLPVRETADGAAVFLTAAPYLLTDGKSLVAPTPIVQATGDTYLDKGGKLRSVKKVKGLVPPSTPLFKANIPAYTAGNLPDLVASTPWTQGVVADQPVLTPNAFPPDPGLTFDGVSDYLLNDNAAIIAAFQAGNYNLDVVFIVMALADVQIFSVGGISNSVNAIQLRLTINGALRIELQGPTPVNTTIATPNGSIVPGVAYTAHYDQFNGWGRLFLNGGLAQERAVGEMPASLTKVSIGVRRRASNGLFFNGHLRSIEASRIL